MRVWDRGARRHRDAASAGDAEHTATEIARIWSHGIHEDNMFIQRGNFFLLAQSLLVVAYTGILAAQPHLGPYGLTVSRVIASFGLAMSAMWIFTGYLHLSYLKHLRDVAISHIPEYGAFRKSWQKAGKLPVRKIDIAVVLAYGVPLLATALWVILIIVVRGTTPRST